MVGLALRGRVEVRRATTLGSPHGTLVSEGLVVHEAFVRDGSALR